ncbi:hypothetical protein MIND_00597400 [Mycena indigotica]|uniref:Protein kinase domain-containing protein n=1 Tax=Mycena indigotica TaxID=2126181 RepID=A0A8H6SPM1_9AGAR|nr:uncharacterized protein MIND_00597400 [Mycena indigotica]KAF7303680.1 hypothetical protein MIND_00597400 [Mycena indigotica]
MSTLELFWPEKRSYLKLWSWTTETDTDYVAHIIKSIANGGRDHSLRVLTARIGAHKTDMTIPKSNRDEKTLPAIVKMAQTPEQIATLEREAAMYRVLKKVQGRAVPKIYGHFRGRVDGKEIQCLLMQYGKPPFMGDRDYIGRYNMDAIYAIHASGIVHGDLLDERHMIESRNTIMVVDLSTATTHRCMHGQKVMGRDGVCRIAKCPEVAALEEKYGSYYDLWISAGGGHGLLSPCFENARSPTVEMTLLW